MPSPPPSGGDEQSTWIVEAAETTFLSDRIDVRVDGEELTVWNSLTVNKHHQVGPEAIQTEHEMLVGDGSTGESPEYVTPAMMERLREIDVYPSVEVVDPAAPEVTVL
jgi:hypothetical protein